MRVVSTPKQIHNVFGSFVLQFPIVRHQSNLPSRPELPPVTEKHCIHSAEHAGLALPPFTDLWRVCCIVADQLAVHAQLEEDQHELGSHNSQEEQAVGEGGEDWRLAVGYN